LQSRGPDDQGYRQKFGHETTSTYVSPGAQLAAVLGAHRFATGVAVLQVWPSGQSASAPAHVHRPVVAAGV
jgi:hypothetical protein